jgi:hypothetical protein
MTLAPGPWTCCLAALPDRRAAAVHGGASVSAQQRGVTADRKERLGALIGALEAVQQIAMRKKQPDPL